MADSPQIHVKGLYTYPNPLGDVPQGSLAVADNLVIDADGAATCRRGIDTLAEAFGGNADRAKKIFSYQDQLLAHYGADTLAYRVPSVGWTAYSGSYPPIDVDTTKVRSVEANSNFYFTTANGVYKLDAYNNTPSLAGGLIALDLTGSLTGSSGFLTNNTALSTTGTVASGSNQLTALGSIAGVTIGQYVSGTNIPAGTTVLSIGSASATITLASASPGDTVTINGVLLTAVAGVPGADQFKVGVTNTADAVSLASAINGDPNLSVIMSATSLSGVVTLTASVTSSSVYPLSTSNSSRLALSGPNLTASSVTMSATATGNATAEAIIFYVGTQVAYRIIWGIKDANNNQILGVPSPRFVLANTSSTSTNASLTLTIPPGATTAYFYQLYRSPQTVEATVEPSDELQLVYEANPSSGDISTGTITFTDTTPDALKGATIYTASSQEGILQANQPPPLAEDICFFRTMMLYANTKSPFRLNVTLLAAGASGLQIGDTITLAGVTYTAASSEGTAQFKVYSSGTPAQNIANTAISFCKIVNTTAANTTVYALYSSGYSDLPGKILIQGRSVGGSVFAMTASAHGTAYNPNLPTSGTSVSATQDVFQHAIYVSKLGQPEAVPLTNQFFVGSAAYPIKRIIPLRDNVLILKDDGIFTLIGQTPTNLYVNLFDNTTKLLAPESAVTLNNTVYCLSNQGVVSISSTGVAVVSRPIEGDLLTLFGASLDGIQKYTFGVSYESDRKYILGVISNSGDTSPTQIYVYNLFTNAWTRWPLSKVSGLVNPADGKLYLGDGSTNTVNVERKSYDYTDYVDSSYSLTITAFSNYTVTLSDTSGITVGDLLFQSTSLRSVVTAVNTSASTVTVSDLLTWSVGAATGFYAIPCTALFQPQTAQSPEMLKQFSEVIIFLKKAQFNKATLSFFSDLSQSVESLDLTNVANSRFGSFVFGTGIFGGALQSRPIRTYIPKAKQRCSQLNLQFAQREAYGNFFLEGFNLKVRNISERTSK